MLEAVSVKLLGPKFRYVRFLVIDCHSLYSLDHFYFLSGICCYHYCLVSKKLNNLICLLWKLCSCMYLACLKLLVEHGVGAQEGHE